MKAATKIKSIETLYTASGGIFFLSLNFLAFGKNRFFCDLLSIGFPHKVKCHSHLSTVSSYPILSYPTSYLRPAAAFKTTVFFSEDDSIIAKLAVNLCNALNYTAPHCILRIQYYTLPTIHYTVLNYITLSFTSFCYITL